MTADILSDEERLGAIRVQLTKVGNVSCRDSLWLLELLDARDARIAELERDMAALDVPALYRERDGWAHVAARVADLLRSKARLAAALAQAEAVRTQMQKALGEMLPMVSHWHSDQDLIDGCAKCAAVDRARIALRAAASEGKKPND